MTNLERTEAAYDELRERDYNKRLSGNMALWEIARSVANLADGIARCVYTADDGCSMFRVTNYKAAPQE